MGFKVAGHRRDAWALDIEILVGCRVLVDFFYVKSFDESRGLDVMRLRAVVGSTAQRVFLRSTRRTHCLTR